VKQWVRCTERDNWCAIEYQFQNIGNYETESDVNEHDLVLKENKFVTVKFPDGHVDKVKLSVHKTETSYSDMGNPRTYVTQVRYGFRYTVHNALVWVPITHVLCLKDDLK
jgi:hypothetical protein